MNSQHIKILVVEDDAVLRKAMVEALSKEFTVISASDGVEGIAVALKERPNLVLLDIAMPHMDGLAVMKELRASGEWGKRIPIILLTSSNADDRIMHGIVENEPSFYLVKSEYSPQGVIQKIKEALGIIKPESVSI